MRVPLDLCRNVCVTNCLLRESKFGHLFYTRAPLTPVEVVWWDTNGVFECKL
jgi:hypothetical protein